MIKIRIDVTGPCGCINNEIELISYILKEKGYSVNITNSYPSKIEFDLLKEVKTENIEIDLIAHHSPWGG